MEYKEKLKQNYVIDTETSQYVTHNQGWFATYELTNGGVLSGNDHFCKVVGVSIVKIKLHNR